MRALHTLVSVALLCAVLAPVAQGCGFMTHQLVTHRAASYYLNMENSTHAGIIKTYLNSVLAGSPFPDYMYTCGSNHDAGEAAHWPRFHAAAAKYIRGLPQPWTESTYKLVAFMYGAISHYIADVNWHGLGTPGGYGFIETLGIADFNCTGDLCSDAHDAADTGGEFVASYASDLKWNHPMEWYVPIADIVQIYAIDGYSVEYTDVMECQVIFLVGDIVVKYLSAIIFEKETSRSAQLVESYFNFHVGGIDDMAIWAVRMWNRWSEWVVNGVPSPLPGPGANNTDSDTLESFLRQPHLFDFAADLRQKGYTAEAYHQLKHYHSRSSHHSTVDFLYALSSDLLQEYADTAKQLGKAASLSALLLFETDPQTRAVSVKLNKEEFNRVLTKKLPELLRKYETLLRTPSARKSAESILHGASARDHARRVARAAMHASSLANTDAMANVESPVPASEGPEVLPVNERVAHQSSYSSCLPVEYFGSSITSADWDHDGIDDLAIGAFGFNGISNCSYPADETPYPQTGAVYVTYSSQPGSQQQISGPSSYSRFGWSTLALDFNGDGVQDLAVGAPTDGWNWTTYAGDIDYRYWGSVLVYFGGKGGLSDQPAYTISTQTGTTLFGVTLSAGDVNGDGLPDLLIGSPYSRGGDPNQVEAGAVHIYLSGSSRVAGGSSMDTEADVILNSPDNFAFFGYSILVANDTVQGPLLIVGAPTYREASQATFGRIYAFPVGSLAAVDALKAASHHVAAAAVFSVTGTVQHGKFGMTLAFGRFNGQSLELAVASPSSNSSAAQNAGVVYVFPVSSLKGDVSLSSVAVSTQLEAGTYGSRLGWRLVAFDMDKDGDDELVVSSPLLTGFLAPHHRGGISLFKGGASFPTGVVTNAETSGYWATSGSVKFARLGDSVAVGDLDGDGMFEVIAGAPNGVSPVNGAEYSGSVFVYSPPKL